MFAVLAVLGACEKKQAAPPAGTASGSAPATVISVDAAAPPADAADGLVELLHAYPASVEVSSHVINKTIRPEHLVDGNLGTAWNSRTGELAGAWVTVWVPRATISELRLTVGHTGRGRNGEDYFAMNPRIKRVSFVDGGKPRTVELDPDQRALQKITLAVPAATVRITVDEVKLGSKKSWREVCISELEAWGTPPADEKPRARTAVVSVYRAPVPVPGDVERGTRVNIADLCDRAMKPLTAEYEAREHHLEDAPPSCGERAGVVVDEAPWKRVAILELAHNESHGPKSCDLVVGTTNGDYLVGYTHDCGPWDEGGLVLGAVRTENVIPGGPPELVIEYRTRRFQEVPVELMICRFANDRVQCTRGMQIVDETYEVKPRFTKGLVVFDPVAGKPPAHVSGSQALEFE